MGKPPDDDPEYEKMPLDILCLTCAVSAAVSSALNMADGWKTYNSHQVPASRGKALVSVIENTKYN